MNKYDWDWWFGHDRDWQSWVLMLLILTYNKKHEIMHLLSRRQSKARV
jgi:hypothetical protein